MSEHIGTRWCHDGGCYDLQQDIAILGVLLDDPVDHVVVTELFILRIDEIEKEVGCILVAQFQAGLLFLVSLLDLLLFWDQGIVVDGLLLQLLERLVHLDVVVCDIPRLLVHNCEVVHESLVYLIADILTDQGQLL